MKKKMFGAIAAVLLLTGCGATGLEGGDSAKDKTVDKKEASELKVGVSLSTLNNPFFVSVRDGVDDLAKSEGVETVVSDAQNDSAKQSNDVDDLIQQKVDVILVNPVDSAAIQPAVEAANQANIPVIALDRSSDGGDVLTLVASDNVKGGEMAAEFIVEKLGEKAKVVQLEGTPGASATRERGEGFTNIAKEKLDVLESQSADFDRAKGLTVMENMMQSTKGIQAVFAQNDEMALGAIEALQGSKGDMIIIGFDGNDDGVKAVKDGKLDGTVAQQPKEMGKLALQAAIDYYAGEDIPEKIDSPLELILK